MGFQWVESVSKWISVIVFPHKIYSDGLQTLSSGVFVERVLGFVWSLGWLVFPLRVQPAGDADVLACTGRSRRLVLVLQSISVLLVACNILCLLVDETAMPKGSRVTYRVFRRPASAQCPAAPSAWRAVPGAARAGRPCADARAPPTPHLGSAGPWTRSRSPLVLCVVYLRFTETDDS